MAFNQSVADQVCIGLAEGKSLRAMASEVGISPGTVLNWIEANTNFAEQYARARLIGYKLLADEIIEISDDSSKDTIETENGPVTNQEVVARSRLRVDTRKWMLSKMLPKVYGDKLDLNHSGYIVTPKELTEADLERIAQAAK